MEDRVAHNRRRPMPIPDPIPAKPPAGEQPLIRVEVSQGRTPLTSSICVALMQKMSFEVRSFTYRGAPIGKPRMTQSDRWKKRPRVLKYRAFADAIREAAGQLPGDPDGVLVTAFIAIPKSWPTKKQTRLAGKPCKQKPDHDNIAKAVGDSLFEEDCGIWLGVTLKYWCPQGEERLEIEVLYAKPT